VIFIQQSSSFSRPRPARPPVFSACWCSIIIFCLSSWFFFAHLFLRLGSDGSFLHSPLLSLSLSLSPSPTLANRTLLPDTLFPSPLSASTLRPATTYSYSPSNRIAAPAFFCALVVKPIYPLSLTYLCCCPVHSCLVLLPIASSRYLFYLFFLFLFFQIID